MNLYSFFFRTYIKGFPLFFLEFLRYVRFGISILEYFPRYHPKLVCRIFLFSGSFSICYTATRSIFLSHPSYNRSSLYRLYFSLCDIFHTFILFLRHTFNTLDFLSFSLIFLSPFYNLYSL